MVNASATTDASRSWLVSAVAADQVALVGREGLLPVPKSVWPQPIVGDRVLIGPAADRVAEVVERRNVLRRADPAGGEQLLAANVDLVAIVCGLDRPLKAGRIQRAAALAWDCEATPVLVLSKSDVAADPDRIASQAMLDNPGMDVLTVSAASNAGMDELRNRLGTATSVLLGESGSGKSTLTNALTQRAVAKVGAVRAGDHKGRHTTTDRHLVELPSGGWLIDTPGIRAIGLPPDATLTHAQFADVLTLATDCHFRDCAHSGEPGCAVVAAVDDGTLPATRLEQWLRLTAEAEAAQRRSDVHAQRQFERKRTKQVYKPAMAKKRKDR